ncbi:MAG: GntR family transcriptional regulator [Parvibaculaceae bacterium]
MPAKRVRQPRSPRAGKANPAEDEAVYETLLKAIMEGRMKAGSKLAEKPLAEVFGVSRDRVRKALHRLVAERRLDAVPNRGVRVPKPTLQDIRRVYQAHRVFEAGVLLHLKEHLSEELFRRLDRNLAHARAAARTGDRFTSIRLSGEFHIILADAIGNAELSGFLRDLLTRSSIMVSVYEPMSDSTCGVDEHADIVEALRREDIQGAIKLSQHHFFHVEKRLLAKRPASKATDVIAELLNQQ